MFTDTILAISSPPPSGRGVRGILRLSGPDAWRLAQQAINLPESPGIGWHAPLSFSLWNTGVPCAVLLFRGPRSFTGQDIAELHLPNSPAILRASLHALIQTAGNAGIAARLAEPGEFSARAFFNGKIDLTRAEGIAATISAANQTELRAATSLREGDLHKQIEALAGRVADALALIEAGIDFADEEGIRFIERSDLASRLDAMIATINEVLASCVRIDQLTAPPTVAFVGKPNVGKSSLINALAGIERSIVSPIAGTTRDILPVMMHTPAGVIRLLDMPGEEPPEDELREKMMAARAAALLDVDLVLEIHAANEPAGETGATEGHGTRSIVIRNKSDLLTSPPHPGDEPWRSVSAKTGRNIAELRQAIAGIVMRRDSLGAGRIVLNPHRHRQAALKETADAFAPALPAARRQQHRRRTSRIPRRRAPRRPGPPRPDHRHHFPRRSPRPDFLAVLHRKIIAFRSACSANSLDPTPNPKIRRAGGGECRRDAGSARRSRNWPRRTSRGCSGRGCLSRRLRA